MPYDAVANDEVIAKTKEALEKRGLTVVVAEDGAGAKKMVLDLLPKGAEVMTSISKTLETTGLDAAIDQSGDYDSVRNKLNAMWGDDSKKRERRKLGAAPDYIIGSVHAITENGEVLVASNTGSQLPAYSHGAGAVIWIAGAQKIVKDLDEAHKRVEEYVLPLESERAKAAYGMPHSNISKLVTFFKELQPGRITVVIVKEKLGF